MMYCAVCHARLNFCSPDIFVCPTGHYALRVIMTREEEQAALQREIEQALVSDLTLSAQLPRTWADPPKRTPVHPWYHDAFRDVEMLEP